MAAMVGAPDMERVIAVVGAGHWGPNHVRVFSALPGASVAWVVDVDAARRRHMAGRPERVRVTSRYEDVLEDAAVDAVVVATPAVTHAPLALAALRAGKHVLCEKPLAVTSAECRDLVGAAAARRLVLMVGHVFLFNGGILKLKALIDTRSLGRLCYASAARLNPGPVRADVGVAWDLASHEVAIFNFLFDAAPVEASAAGRSCSGREREDVAFITLRYPGDLVVGITVSWIDPRKVRTLSLVGDRAMATFDDLAAHPVAVHAAGDQEPEPYYDSFGEFQRLGREGNVVIPAIPSLEPLKEQARHFLDAMARGDAGPVAGERGWAVVQTLEAITESMRQGGRPVPIATVAGAAAG
jgi:predicted dehydrogenase